MVKSWKRPGFSFKISFLVKTLVILVRKNRLLCPILIRKIMLLSPICVRKKWLPVQYEQEKKVTHYNLDPPLEGDYKFIKCMSYRKFYVSDLLPMDNLGY
jgi:hypothetical protein